MKKYIHNKLFLLTFVLTCVASSCAPVPTVAQNTVVPVVSTALDTPMPSTETSSSPTDGTIQFSGYEWTVRDSGLSGPGPNLWSRDNVWLDEAGDLHLKITYTENGWQCAELATTERLGFGIYQFQVVGRVDQLDPNVVLGLFNYPTDDVGADATNEIDIEYAHWGNSDWDIGNFTVWPAESGIEQTSETFPLELNGTYTTQRFSWESGQIYFQALHGHRDDNEAEIKSWLYKPDEPLIHIPQHAMPLHMNLWLFEGMPPMDGSEVEIVIHSFTFTALEK